MTIASVLVHAQKPIARMKVSDLPEFYRFIPVSVSLDRLPESLKLASLRLVTAQGSQSHPVPFQIDQGEPSRLWWMLLWNGDTEDVRFYELQMGNQVPDNHIEIHLDDTGLETASDGARILRYNYAPIPPPEGENPLYIRSGFIHPIWTPQGKILTRIHPGDHIHHMGFWNPWTKTEFQGRSVDFWNLKEGQGTVRFVRFASMETGPVFAGFEAVQAHVDFTSPKGEIVVLNELWKVCCWNKVVDQSIWMWDFTTNQTCASEDPLLLQQYRYGGFGFRGTSDWTIKNSDFLTSEGKTRVNGNGTRGRWCQMYGKTDQGSAGVVFMSHPDNHEHPEPMRIWPDGDIFFGFCPVVHAEWELIPGETYIRQYRALVYDGTMGAEEIETYWKTFAYPPKVEIEWINR